MKTFSKITLAAAALALLAIAAASPHGHEAQGHDSKHSEARWNTIVIDVAEDMRTLSANTASPTDTEPKRGTTAIINGKIYPGGTIAAGDGLDVDMLTGSTGTWISRGTFNFDLSEFVRGAPLLSATQHYLFSPRGALDGEDSLMSEGPEFGVTTPRVVLGGTGRYRGVIGEVTQETLGFNSTGFANFRFTFTIRSAE